MVKLACKGKWSVLDACTYVCVCEVHLDSVWWSFGSASTMWKATITSITKKPKTVWGGGGRLGGKVSCLLAVIALLHYIALYCTVAIW